MTGMARDNQRGITLIEVAIVVAIVGGLTVAFGSIVFAMLRHTETSNAHMAAACATENAARLIANDGQMAQNTDLVPGAGPVNTVKLTWTDPVTGDLYEISYFPLDDDLRRKESIDSIVQGEKTVATDVSSIEFSQPTGEERLFTVTVTSSGGSPRVSETREYHVTLRAVD